jgi:hypothetical protein
MSAEPPRRGGDVREVARACAGFHACGGIGNAPWGTTKAPRADEQETPSRLRAAPDLTPAVRTRRTAAP